MGVPDADSDQHLCRLWRPVDAAGEVLDALVQSKRNKFAALKLMEAVDAQFASVRPRGSFGVRLEPARIQRRQSEPPNVNAGW